jgi:Ca-activated chloride channel family protein
MTEMFEYPHILWLFLGFPLFAGLLLLDLLIFKRRAERIGGYKKEVIIPYYSEGQKWLKLVFFSMAFLLTVLGLARPRWGIESVDADLEGRDILVVLDVSFSMAANDIIPNRLEAAKRGVREFLAMETGDQVGLLVFSGRTLLYTPVTHDYGSISFFLDSLYPGMVGKGSTNIGRALQDSISIFDDTEVSSKMILLITDGENIVGDLSSMLGKISESGIKVFTIGVGTRNGEPIPIRNSNNEIIRYVKDKNGKHVISKLDEKSLIKIAKETNGSFMRSTGRSGEFENFINSISGVDTTEYDQLSYNQKKERYGIFLLPALILFTLGFILDQGRFFKFRKNRFEWLLNRNLIVCLLLPLFMFCFSGELHAQQDLSGDRTASQAVPSKAFAKPNGGFWGNRHFKKEEYKKALDDYFSAIHLLKDEALARLKYNIANTFLKLQSYEQAEQFYNESASLSKEKELLARVRFNQGYGAFENGQYSQAAGYFKESILYNPQDDDARYNYAVALEFAKNQPKGDDQQDQQENQENNQDQQQQQEQQSQEQQQDRDLSQEEIEQMLKALAEKERSLNREQAEEQEKNQQNRGVYY